MSDYSSIVRAPDYLLEDPDDNMIMLVAFSTEAKDQDNIEAIAQTIAFDRTCEMDLAPICPQDFYVVMTFAGVHRPLFIEQNLQ